MYQVIIVEDDPMVAMLNRGYVERDSRFTVVQEFHDGRSALIHLRQHPTDLVILDIYMPSFGGMDLLKEIRKLDCKTDVIMITAASDPETFDTAMKLGAIDYLVKPFVCQRFQMALDKFLQYRQSLGNTASLQQEEIDRILGTGQESVEHPKGLQEKTLAMIRNHMRRESGRGQTSEQIAECVNLSRVTVRRYMNYMLGTGEISSNINYDTGGRPCMVYQYGQQGIQRH